MQFKTNEIALDAALRYKYTKYDPIAALWCDMTLWMNAHPDKITIADINRCRELSRRRNLREKRMNDMWEKVRR